MGNSINRIQHPSRSYGQPVDRRVVFYDSSIDNFRPVEVVNGQPTKILAVLSVDLCIKENNNEHHTDHFYNAHDTLIVRRGEPFRIRLHFNRAFNPAEDAISFIFTMADIEKPRPGHGTLAAIVPHDGIDHLGDPLEWGAGIEQHDLKCLSLLIKPSVTAPIGQWKLDIDTKIMNAGSLSYTLASSIYVLFNPWCREDQVYMADRDCRKEYVMHDTTFIWRGSYNRLRPSVWKLGQFDNLVLDCALGLLSTVGQVPGAHRGDPIRVARALAAAVNSVDDEGIVLGNWTEDFSGGTAPTKWSGSVGIIQEFYRTRKPVKYGQCWTFAGVLTTISRALGIPSRIVTCYSAAHDTQGSLTVDIFIDKNNKKMDADISDSVWNYHVWNEMWMKRPDLGVGSSGTYDGWQAVDATPQEPSDSLYRVGPAPVLAVKNGEIKRPFDCGFVFSEVNADKVYWRYNGPTKPLKMLRKDTLAIGQLISTKAVLKWERQDITNSYKHEERTEQERNTMIKALKMSRHAFSRYYLNDSFNDVAFTMQLYDDIIVGQNFTVVLSIRNKSLTHAHTATGQINCDSILYTGVNFEEVKSIDFEVDIQPNSLEFIRLEVLFEDYYKKLTSQASFNISCSGKVKNTDYEYYAQDDFRVRKPDIHFTFSNPMVARKPLDIIVRLANPLPIPLRKCIFTMEGPGIDTPLRFKINEIPVGRTAASAFEYIPPYAGRATLIAKFISKELDDVDGMIHYTVQANPEDLLMDTENTKPIIRRRTDVIP